MKRWAAAGLLICLMLGLAGQALAYSDYYGWSLGSLGVPVADLCGPSWRGTAAAAVLRDWMAASGNTWVARQLGGGSCSVANLDGVGLDLYYPLLDGSYLNLYAEPGSGLIRDYGTGIFSKASNGYYYASFGVEEVKGALGY